MEIASSSFCGRTPRKDEWVDLIGGRFGFYQIRNNSYFGGKVGGGSFTLGTSIVVGGTLTLGASIVAGGNFTLGGCTVAGGSFTLGG
jgi:hypothetical protein